MKSILPGFSIDMVIDLVTAVFQHVHSKPHPKRVWA
jgi:hypothetical protein